MPKTSTQINPQLRLFLIATMCLGIATGIFETTFNNFLSDTFDLGADARGYLEFPRELPGFLTVLIAAFLFFMAETRVAACAALAIAAGLFGLALRGSAFAPMLVFLVLWSAGAHLMMPLRESISMHLSDRAQQGRRLGQVNAVDIGASIIGCVVVWVTLRYLLADYRITFVAAAVAALAGAAVMARMRLPGAHLRRTKFVWRRRYWLFYVLAALFGARKQIFITFGPWVLVRVFNQPAYIFAQLWIVAALIGMVFQPLLGKAIDRFGERRVLMLDSLCVLMVCIGYGCAHLIPNSRSALFLLYACFVADRLLFGANMARSTYIAKIAEKPEHVAPSLSLGVTINHAVSMSAPMLGGVLWIRYGHPSVFVAAGAIAVLMFVFTSMIRVPEQQAATAV